jgi:hypothetical protein
VEEQPDPTPPTLKDALNVAPGDFAGCLQQAGARRSRVFPLLDDLTWGPCAADPARHDALRRAHWKRIYRSVHPWQRDWLDWLDEIPLLASARLRQRACASKIPIVVWTSGSVRESLPALWALSQLQAARVEPARIWLSLPIRRGANWRALAWHPAEEIPKMLARARLAGGRYAQSARLWRAWCATSPRQLVRRSSQTRPPLDIRPYAGLLPTVREDDNRVLRLSRVDALLLGSFSTMKWSQPRELLSGSRKRLLRDLILTHGDLFVFGRWREWSMRPLGPALEARRELGGQGGWGDVVYRLTAFGESLLRQGMNGPEEIPPLHVGGHDCASPNGI